MQDSNNQNPGTSLVVSHDGATSSNDDGGGPHAMDGFAALAQVSADRLADQEATRNHNFSGNGNTGGDGSIQHLTAAGPRSHTSPKSYYSTSSSSKDGNGSSSSSSVCSGTSSTPPLGNSSTLPASRDLLSTAALCAAVSGGGIPHGNAPLSVVQESSAEQDLTKQAEALIGLATISSVAPPVPETNREPLASGPSSIRRSHAMGAPSQPPHIDAATMADDSEIGTYRSSKRPLPSNVQAASTPPLPSFQHSQGSSSPPVVRLRPLVPTETGLGGDLTAQSPPSLFAPRQKLRRGKWTPEEEAFVARVIQDFNSGFLRAPAGTTLRTYLSEKLHCDPMRITKKFTGDSCIGKRVFHPAVRCAANAFEIDKAQAELDALEAKWRKRLETQQKEAARRANRHGSGGQHQVGEGRVQASSASARPLHHSSLPQTIPADSRLGLHPQPPPSSHHCHQEQQVAVTQTATWLDKATSLLSNKNASPADVAAQLQQMEELIHEGPQIRQSLPALVNKQAAPDQVLSTDKTIAFTAPESQPSRMQVAEDLPVQNSSGSQPNSSMPHLNITAERVTSESGLHQVQEHQVVTETANWLDQANMLLEKQQQQQLHQHQPGEVERQLQQMEHLIHQGPQIRESSAGLPQMIQQRQQQPEARRGPTPNLVSQTSDAEALVGFINSIRQESESAREQEKQEQQKITS